MQTSIFIAQLLGPAYMVVGLALLSRPQAFRVILREFIGSHVPVYLAGFIGLLTGLALVLVHNVWALDWRLIITLLAWVVLIRALVTIFWPEQIVSLGSKILENKRVFAVAGTANLIIGLVLCYFGYVAP
jgi:uncharacterized membrane protein